MPLNWSKLSPHRPLKPNDPLHVRRPDGGGEELAEWIRAGADTVAIAGPVGSGKSSELAWAASRLQSNFVVVQVPLDRLLDMRRVTEEDVFVQVTGRVVDVAHNTLHIPLSDALRQRLAQADAPAPAPGKLASPGRDLLLNALREVTQQSRQGALVLLLDGLEKCEAASALGVVRALLEVRHETQLVFVAPYPLVVGSGAHELVGTIDRFFFVRAVPVRRDQGASGEDGRAFLREIVRARLDLPALPEDLAALLDRAAEASGGVPRSFLQLVRAASQHAALEDRDLLTEDDLRTAMRDHAENLERELIDGDIDQLRAADGTSGVEIPEERRLRLLIHGLLLEYKTDGATVVHPAPLLQPVLARRGAS
jgi:hypothetical protein